MSLQEDASQKDMGLNPSINKDFFLAKFSALKWFLVVEFALKCQFHNVLIVSCVNEADVSDFPN